MGFALSTLPLASDLPFTQNRTKFSLNFSPLLEFFMNLATHVRPISYLKSHAAEIAKDVTETGEPMLITQNGEARLVVMDVASYEQKEQTLALLKMLAMGQRDIEQSRYRDAEDVFADMDKEDGE